MKNGLAQRGVKEEDLREHYTPQEDAEGAPFTKVADILQMERRFMRMKEDGGERRNKKN